MNLKQKNKLLEVGLRALEDDLSSLEHKAIITIHKRFKSDYKAIKRELDRLYKKYEKDGVFDYNRFIYNADDIELQIKVAKRMINTFTLIDKAIDKLLNKSANQVIRGVDNIKVLQSIPYRYDTSSVVNESVKGFNWATRLGRNRKEVITRVMKEVDEGLRKGLTYTETSRKLSEELGISLRSSERIARTETHRVVNTMKEERFNNIKNKNDLEKEWISSRDERVRSQHAEMDGQRVRLDEEFVFPDGYTTKAPGVSGVAYHDINCRCTMRLVFTR